jgi:hypothetical protein
MTPHQAQGRTLLVIVASLLGVGLTAWGLWAAYVGIVNYDRGSELPRWFAFLFAAVLIAVGGVLLALVHSARGREHRR